MKYGYTSGSIRFAVVIFVYPYYIFIIPVMAYPKAFSERIF